eukprot:m.65783 g.65783  ORF g.65783 m.65783 type:complete len:51 (-) comp7588_c0_seq1:1156-1308(-)
MISSASSEDADTPILLSRHPGTRSVSAQLQRFDRTQATQIRHKYPAYCVI